MTKITTADCKKFLVAEITKNPEIIHDIYGDKTTAIKEALDAKNWVRELKFNANGDHEYADDTYELWCPTYGPSRGSVPATSLTTVRKFTLDPDQFDNAVAFMVLEDKQGNLMLGAYSGD